MPTKMAKLWMLSTPMNHGLIGYFKSLSMKFSFISSLISLDHYCLKFIKYSLRWCRDCIDLVINLAYPEKDAYSGEPLNDEDMLDSIEAELFPLLEWMKNLKSLAILRNGSNYVLKGARFFFRLFDWLSPLFNKSGTYPEHLWSTNYAYPFSDSFTHFTPSSVFGSYLQNVANLENIANANYGPFSVHSNPNLKYLRGYCRNNNKV